MSSASALPPALLDLTWLRASARLGSSNANACGHAIRRRMHLATAPSPSMPPPELMASGDAFGHRRRRRVPSMSLAVLQTETNRVAQAELARRVESLTKIEVSQRDIVEPEPGPTEDELLAIYKDLLAIEPPPSQLPESPQNQKQMEDWSLVERIAERLAHPQTPYSHPSRAEPEGSLTNALRQRLGADTSAEESVPDVNVDVNSPHRRVLARLREILPRFEAAQRSLHPILGGTRTVPKSQVPIVWLLEDEWKAMIRVCLELHEPDLAEETLVLMKRASVTVPEESIDDVMTFYAAEADVPSLENFMQNFLTTSPTPHQRHLHIKAHQRSAPKPALPTSALTLLHTYENASLPAPQETYHHLITHLLHTTPAHSPHLASISRAQAWDLFAHMRYAAHPHPSEPLYATMLLACAHTHRSEPERALDLWTEMTVDRRLQPSERSYGGVIMALARSGEREYVGEAFRLAREMLGGGVGGSGVNRDAYGRGRFRPGQLVFLALLEGAKRMGDLPRVRWILAEMVRTVEGGDGDGVRGKGEGEVEINEEVMMYVFNAYAAYRPPFKRSLAPLVKDAAAEENTTSPSATSAKTAESASSSSSTPSTSQHHEQTQTSVKSTSPSPSPSPNTSFSHIPPQSRSEVLREAKAIFTQIVDAQSSSSTQSRSSSSSSTHSQSDTTPSIFRNVKLTTPLLNSYLSIHYAHNSLEASHKLFLEMFGKDDPALRPSGRSLVEALERCAMPIRVEKDRGRDSGDGGVDVIGKSEKEREREVALRFAEDVWREWEVLEERGMRCEDPKERVGARMIERATSAMIRILALTKNLPRALSLLRTFTTRYPPSTLRQPTPLPSLRSTRTVLTSPTRPIVRLTSPIEVPDDTVPPLLLWRDLEVLHHRLVAAGDKKGIGMVKWVGRAYEGSLRRRRDGAMRDGNVGGGGGGGTGVVPVVEGESAMSMSRRSEEEMNEVD